LINSFFKLSKIKKQTGMLAKSWKFMDEKQIKNETIEEKLEKELRCKVIKIEGIGATGARIFWNRQNCPYHGRCYLQESKEKNQPKPCLYNPSMFKCPAYQHYELRG
jgi:hypothetical protein